MNSTDYQVQQLQLRVRELETRVLQLEDRVVFNPPVQPQQDEAWKAEQKAFADEAVKWATEALSDPKHPATIAAREYYGTAQRKPLPSYEIVTMYDERPTSDGDMIAFARAIEHAHGIK